MTIEDDIIIPFIVGISAIILTIGHQTLLPRSSVESLQRELDQSYITESAALREVDTLTHQLEEYHSTEESLISLGASHTQAVAVIRASEVYSIDPKY